jgi:carbon-monoxide dehydrogenase large subunit
MILSDRTGIPMEDITVVHGDTDLIPVGGGTMGSRSLQMGGVALHEAAGELVEAARVRAAELLEADPGDLLLDVGRGVFHVAGSPDAAVGWAALAGPAGHTGETGQDLAGGLSAEATHQLASPTFPFGAHVAVVEVDTESGKTTLRRLLTVDDAGRILNPIIVEGQRHGGIAQGVAQALFEEMAYDADGTPITTNFADYAFVSAPELPDFELLPMETPTHVNELGAKGIGESGTIGSTPAVQSAVIDAIAHLGVRHLDMPLSPERVWRAVTAARAGQKNGEEAGS